MRRRTGTIEARPSGYRIRYTDLNGIRHSENYDTREAAEFHLAERLHELAAGVPVTSRANTVTFKELAADVVNDYTLNRYGSIEDIKGRFRNHILPVFGRMKAARITTAQIKAYQVARMKDGAKPATINREIEAIGRTFRLAMEGKKIFTMPHISTLRLDNARKGFFTREEVERLCSHLSKPLDSFVRFAWITGWRRGEITNLRWMNVDFARGEVRLEPGTTKNREGRTFPMTKDLRAILENLKPESAFPGQLVFLYRGRPLGQFRKSWLTACDKAKLPCVYDTKGKPVKALRILHDLRRSAAREMASKGIPQHIIQKLMGHKTGAMFQRYAIVSEADLRNAVTLLDAAVVPGNVPEKQA